MDGSMRSALGNAEQFKYYLWIIKYSDVFASSITK